MLWVWPALVLVCCGWRQHVAHSKPTSALHQNLHHIAGPASKPAPHCRAWGRLVSTLTWLHTQVACPKARVIALFFLYTRACVCVCVCMCVCVFHPHARTHGKRHTWLLLWYAALTHPPGWYGTDFNREADIRAFPRQDMDFRRLVRFVAAPHYKRGVQE